MINGNSIESLPGKTRLDSNLGGTNGLWAFRGTLTLGQDGTSRQGCHSGGGWAEPLSQDTGNVIFQMAAILVVLEMSLIVLSTQRRKDMSVENW